MRPRLRKLTHFLFGQNFGAVVDRVAENPNELGYRLPTIPEQEQANYLAWVHSLPEAEKIT